MKLLSLSNKAVSLKYNPDKSLFNRKHTDRIKEYIITINHTPIMFITTLKSSRHCQNDIKTFDLSLANRVVYTLCGVGNIIVK